MEATESKSARSVPHWPAIATQLVSSHEEVNESEGIKLAKAAMGMVGQKRCSHQQETYRTQGNGGSSETDQAPVSRMGLVNGIGILVAELFDNVAHSLEILCCSEISNHSLKSRSSSIHSSAKTRVLGDASGRAILPHVCIGATHSSAPILRLSYSLSLRALWMLASMVAAEAWQMPRI